MSSGPLRNKAPQPKSPLCKTSTPPLSPSPEPASSRSADRVDTILPLFFISVRRSNDGEDVFLRFSDHREFTFPASWLHQSRKDESLPSPDEGFCKNPAKICASGVKVSGEGRWATVDITWNTGTTSRFPALWLRVWGPEMALGEDRESPRFPEPKGKDPRSGVEQLTQGEKRVRDEYRWRLIEIMTEFMNEDWLDDVPTSLLREMVEYVEMELQSESLAAQALAEERIRDDAAAESSGDDTLIDEDVAS